MGTQIGSHPILPQLLADAPQCLGSPSRARAHDLCELYGKARPRDGQELCFPYLYDFGFRGLPPRLPLMRACSFPASVFGPVDSPPWNLQRPFL